VSRALITVTIARRTVAMRRRRTAGSMLAAHRNQAERQTPRSTYRVKLGAHIYPASNAPRAHTAPQARIFRVLTNLG
jgi:hypothetical protein